MNTVKIPDIWQLFVSRLCSRFQDKGITWNPVDEWISEENCEITGGQLLLFGLYFLYRTKNLDGSFTYYLDHAVDASDPSVGLFNVFEPTENPTQYDSEELVLEIILEAALGLEKEANEDFCGVSCAHKSDVHDCPQCSVHVDFICAPACEHCISMGRDSCGCYLPFLQK